VLVLLLLVCVLCTGYQQKEASPPVMRPHLPAQLMARQCHNMLPALSEQLSQRTFQGACRTPGASGHAVMGPSYIQHIWLTILGFYRHRPGRSPTCGASQCMMQELQRWQCCSGWPVALVPAVPPVTE